MYVNSSVLSTFKNLQIKSLFTLTKPIKNMDEVRKQVFETFGTGKIGGEMFERNLEKLMNVMSKLTSEEVQLDRELLRPRTREDAPVTYIEILEHSRFTINMFVLRPGSRLPLHDHPNMYGICKVIEGKVKLRNFSLDAKRDGCKVVKALLDSETIVSKCDEAILLTPVKGNVHEMRAMEGGAAFVDVLAPPYLSNIDGLGPRPCQYFIESNNSKTGDLVDLIRVDRVSDYYTDFAPYQGQ